MNEAIHRLESDLTGIPEGLFETAGFGALVIDPVEDRVISMTEPCARLLDGDALTLSGIRPSELFRSVLPELHVLTEACLIGPGNWQSEFTLVTVRDRTVEVECHAAHYRPSGKSLISLLLFDARRQRKRMARVEFEALYRGEPDAIRKTDQMFRDLERGNKLLLDAAGEGIYGVNKLGQTTFVNPAAERMLGWKAEEIVGKVAHDVIHHTHACGDHYPIHDCPIYNAFKEGVVHEVRGEVFWRKDGGSFPVDYTSTPIEDDGKLVGAVVVFRDVSKQNEQETRLRQALAEVERLRARLEMEKDYLLDELDLRQNRHEIVGSSPAVAQTIEQIDLVAPAEATVLITGESGTGKELIARAIHNASPRRNRPLIRVNCAAIPAELFESEFFGHVKGAFTGAVSTRAGRFELADGGTLFLDEVGELPLEQQGKLLRVLQEQQFERVGDTKTIHVDVRVIAATNRELRHLIMEKRFREDLYFRLAVFPIHSAPLRDRREDIPPLAALFLQRAVERLNRSLALNLTVANIAQLQAYDWPGNIRELENVLERAVILARDGRLQLDLPVPKNLKTDSASAPGPDGVAIDAEPAITLRSDLRKMEVEAITSALDHAHGKVSGPGGAAELLDMKATTLYARIKKFGIEPREYKKKYN